MKKVAIRTIRQIALVVLKNNRKAIIQVVKSKMTLRNHECYVPVVNRFVEKCINLNNEYVLRNLYVFVNLCEIEINSEHILNAIDEVCVVY